MEGNLLHAMSKLFDILSTIAHTAQIGIRECVKRSLTKGKTWKIINRQAQKVVVVFKSVWNLSSVGVSLLCYHR